MTSQTLAEAAQAECLDALEELRRAGISKELPLPQIVVVGDQSSGKSSIIERLTGAAIPSKEGLCTRNPMLLNLRFGHESSTIVSIMPSDDRSPLEKIDLQSFSRSIGHPSELGPVFEDVAKLLGVDQASSSRRFCKDVLKIDFTGPKNLNLALIDLPGLFQISNRRQTDEDAEFVRDMIKEWVTQERTTKLIVISAKTEPVQHYSLKFLQELNQQKSQSIGAITHADYLVDQTGVNFQDYADFLAGKDQPVQWGWFMLNNQAGKKGSSLDQRTAAEAVHFVKKPWGNIPSSVKGLGALEQCLLRVQLQATKQCLPDLIEGAKDAISSTKSQLQELSKKRNDPEVLRRQINITAREFEGQLRKTKDNSRLNNEHPALSLRYNVGQTMTNFANALRDVTTAAVSGGDEAIPSPIVQLMRYELEGSSVMSGQLDLDIMSKIFYESTMAWATLTATAIDETIRDTRRYLLNLISMVSNGQLLDGFEVQIVEPAMKKLRNVLQHKVDGVLETHKDRTPVSFYTTLQEQIGSTRGLYVRDLFTKELTRIQGGTTVSMVPKSKEEMAFQMTQIADALQDAANDVDACTEREFEVCLKAHIIEESKKLGIYFNFETVLRDINSQISKMFSRDVVDEFDSGDLMKLCRQGQNTQAEKRLFEEKINLIESALEKLQRFQAGQSLGSGRRHHRHTPDEVVFTPSSDADTVETLVSIEKWKPKRKPSDASESPITPNTPDTPDTPARKRAKK